MSKPHMPGRSFQTPERDSKGWKRLIARGCGAKYDYWNEFYCSHGYNCACEECPHGILAAEKRELEWFRDINSLQGPPRNLKHPYEFWDTPSVSAELVWMFGDEAQFMTMVKAAMELPPKETNYAGDFRAFILVDRGPEPGL